MIITQWLIRTIPRNGFLDKANEQLMLPLIERPG